MKNMLKSLLGISTLMICLLSPAGASEYSGVKFETHNIELRLTVEYNRAEISDSGTVAVKNGWNFFLLSSGAEIEFCNIAGEPVQLVSFEFADSVTLPDGQIADLTLLKLSGSPQVHFFESDQNGSVTYHLKFEADFADEVEGVRFSRERVGNEISGTILEKGAYLSGSAYYYPNGEEKLASFQVTANIPSAWESISDGNLISSVTEGDRKVQTFRNPYKSDGLMFMAAPYVTKSIDVDGTEVACYFFAEDTSMFDRYLEGTADYIRMYNELIGPYPYERFTVAENFFPTGYGMPAWTLLGQQVLRLPFILGTSLGHEVLHNWWGNSVYVDYDRGNWCEAATVYGADYRYKLLSSPEEARDYRKDILKQYKSYVNEGNDFAIGEFRSRTDPSTRVIGYNKAMMVYHMVHEIMGDSLFFEAWRSIYDNYREKQISWSEWFAAFEKLSSKPLSYMIPEWIDRPGAPQLALEVKEKNTSDGSVVVNFVLTDNGGQDYTLRVPARLKTETETVDTILSMAGSRGEYSLRASGSTGTLSIDPEYHLFRALYDEEVEPVVSAILGSESLRYVTGEQDSIAASGFQSFCNNFAENEAEVETFENLQNNSDAYLVMLNPSELPDYFAEWVVVTEDSISVAGSSYPREGHTVVLAGNDWSGFGKYLVVLTSDFASLPRLGQLVPHYGKYSYLVFGGSSNIGKGQWEVTSSPLSASF